MRKSWKLKSSPKLEDKFSARYKYLMSHEKKYIYNYIDIGSPTNRPGVAGTAPVLRLTLKAYGSSVFPTFSTTTVSG